MQRVKSFALVFALLLVIWLLLTYPFSIAELVAGSAAALVIALLPTGAARVMREVRVSPRALIAAIAYARVFLVALVRANLDVAFRVLKPSLPISPGIVRIRTSLTTPLARTLLANSITLTPGTITVEARGDLFYVHWISVSDNADIEEATRSIVGRFERYLEVFLG
ncbi:MAG: Na+/H+ antiporter subunit E [Spirochaetota bacterium]